MTIENGRPLTPGLPADRRQASAGRVRQLASISTFILRLAATFAMAIVPVRASDFATTSAEVNARNLFRRAAVLSDAPGSIHDSRHPQPPNRRRQNVRTYRTRLDQSPSTRPRHRGKVRSSYGNGLPCFAVLRLSRLSRRFRVSVRAPEGRARRGGAERFRDL
jgi:hypothetical protein